MSRFRDTICFASLGVRCGSRPLVFAALASFHRVQSMSRSWRDQNYCKILDSLPGGSSGMEEAGGGATRQFTCQLDALLCTAISTSVKQPTYRSPIQSTPWLASQPCRDRCRFSPTPVRIPIPAPNRRFAGLGSSQVPVGGSRMSATICTRRGPSSPKSEEAAPPSLILCPLNITIGKDFAISPT